MKELIAYIQKHPQCLDEKIRGEKSTLFIFGGLNYLSEIMPILRRMGDKVLDIGYKGYRLAVAIKE